MITQILSSIIGVFAFAVLFHAPKRSWLFCALCGGISWGIFLACAAWGLSDFLCGAVAVFGLTVVARILSVATETPATTFLVCGIFPIVPGAGIYHTAYGLMTGDMARFTLYGNQTIALAGAIAIGIIIGMGVPTLIPTSSGKLLKRLLPATLRRSVPVQRRTGK